MNAAAEEEDNESFPVTHEASIWGEDPLFWSYLILLNIHVAKGLLPNGNSWEEVTRRRERMKCNHALPNGRVVGYANLVGTLVRKQVSSQITTFTIDDGTALIDCVEWGNEDEKVSKGLDPRLSPELGNTIRCFGKLEWPSLKFQSNSRSPVRRLVLSRPVCIVSNVNEELNHWLTASQYWQTCYARPFKLSNHKETSLVGGGLMTSSVFGGQIEDAIMNIIRSANRMPLISSVHEHRIKMQFGPFIRACFQRDVILQEEPLASLLLLARQTNTATETLQVSLKKLCRNGLILVLDPAISLYAVITHEDFIAPAILRNMTKFQTKFVSHRDLLNKIREDPRLHFISSERIDGSISRLLLEGFLFEGDSIGSFSLNS